MADDLTNSLKPTAEGPVRDGSNFSELFARMAKQRAAELARMSEDERLIDFLKRCNQRGSKYLPGIDTYPTHSQLARYCDCQPSTIYRIMTGATKSPSAKTLSILRAIACLDLPVNFEDCSAQIRYCLADAYRWLSASESDRGELLDAIHFGIRARAAVPLN